MAVVPMILRRVITTRCLFNTANSTKGVLVNNFNSVTRPVKSIRFCPSLSSPGTCFERLIHLQANASTEELFSESKLKPDKNAEEILANLDPVKAKKLKVLQLEVDVLQQVGAQVPDTFRPSWWVNLLDIETSSARRKYYRYLRKIENTQKSKELKRVRRAQLRAEKKADAAERTEAKNTIFMHIRKKTMNQSHHYKLAHAMVFGPEVIVDLGFDNVMQSRECINLADQLWFAYGINRLHPEPFHIIFTDAHPHSQTVQALGRSCHDSSLDKMLFTMTEKSYLDLYPKERLVYLTPNAKDELTHFNYDDVYIVGGLVDKSNTKPVTMAKAKEQNIRMAKLPLDRHLVWCQGTKSLTVDQVLQILLDIKTTNSWKSALRHVPKRKVLHTGYK